jgi:DNA-binding MarR family transcriptional regulator
MSQKPGEDNVMAKLTEEQVRELRRLAKTHQIGWLAEKYGITRSNVSMIVHHRSWKHIP